ncbi:MAG: hypothetical protein OXR03_16915, partial [Rhodospirillaceae bacterium]|nr:hypothetical protein [Rhodospirillaceae bacterium]
MASAHRAIGAYCGGIALPFSWELPLFFSFTNPGQKSRALHKHKRSAQQARANRLRASGMTGLRTGSSAFRPNRPLLLDTVVEFLIPMPWDTGLSRRTEFT